MKVNFFTKGDIGLGSSRQRAFFVSAELEKRGWKTVLHKPEIDKISTTKWPQKATLIKQLLSAFINIKKDEVIYVHKGIYNKYFLIILAIFKIISKHKIIVDFDDAVFTHSPRKTKFLLRFSDVVIGGSHFICEWANKYHKNVHLIPTSILFSIYSKYTKNYSLVSEKELTVGWVGHGPMHYVSLRHIAPVFKKLIDSGVKFNFTLVGSLGDKRLSELFDILGLKVKFINNLDWTDPNNVAEEIGKFDIGVMPLEDIEIEKGKCAFKAVEYMACGVASICSTVGENSYLIKDGVNGLLAKDWKDWPEKIELLIKNQDLRKKIGQAGQETIKEHYSFEVNIPRIENIIRSLDYS